MLAYQMAPVSIDPLSACANPGQSAFRALTAAAAAYLDSLTEAVAASGLPSRAALVSRVRGTGPGVSFGSFTDALQAGIPARWNSPFEGSSKVSGAVLIGRNVTNEDRDDAFLWLRFEPGALDLPLHTHDFSERFIYVLSGRGFFHVTQDPLDDIRPSNVRHVPVRSRDVLMFSRGTVHTFSTNSEPLMLLSYHRPYIPLDDGEQYSVSTPPVYPRELLSDARGRVSFDAGWTRLA